MKYLVDVNGERVEVVLDAGRATVNGQTVAVQLSHADAAPVRVLRLGNEVHGVLVRRGERRGRYTLWLDGFRYDVDALDARTRAIRDLSDESGKPTGPAPLVAPMPGLIVRVHVAPGDEVRAGQGLVVMEAMKMENELRSSAAGVVRAVHVAPGTAVEKGARLIELG